MIVHIGNDVVIPVKNIVAVIGIDTIESEDCNKEFLKKAKDRGFIKDISNNDKQKSVILAKAKDKCIVYLSPISSITIARRIAADKSAYNSIT